MMKRTQLVGLLAVAIPWWQFQAIDTMKYSRDLSLEKLNDSSFDQVITKQMSDIAATGATHVAIATPYDDVFELMLARWVKAARQAHLKVWFRGNWAGWEQWFGFTPITRQEHITKTQDFIIGHPQLFADGDIFSACPECENGGPGDPRTTGDVVGHRQFIITEYQATAAAFQKIHKRVASNWYSMNADVARLVMDRPTTAALDGLVVIDHYVADPAQLAQDVADIASTSGGKVALGEFGAPVPNLHGTMTEQQQAEWTETALQELSQSPDLVGVSWWVNQGGSTQLWNDDGQPRLAAHVLKTYYRPGLVKGFWHLVWRWLSGLHRSV